MNTADATNESALLTNTLLYLPLQVIVGKLILYFATDFSAERETRQRRHSKQQLNVEILQKYSILVYSKYTQSHLQLLIPVDGKNKNIKEPLV